MVRLRDSSTYIGRPWPMAQLARMVSSRYRALLPGLYPLAWFWRVCIARVGGRALVWLRDGWRYVVDSCAACVVIGRRVLPGWRQLVTARTDRTFAPVAIVLVWNLGVTEIASHHDCSSFRGLETRSSQSYVIAIVASATPSGQIAEKATSAGSAKLCESSYAPYRRR